MESCDQSWNFTNCAHEFYQIYARFSYMKFRMSLETLHFLSFSVKCPWSWKIKRMVIEKMRNKMCKGCGNLEVKNFIQGIYSITKIITRKLSTFTRLYTCCRQSNISENTSKSNTTLRHISGGLYISAPRKG